MALRPSFCLFVSGRLRQVSLYMVWVLECYISGQTVVSILKLVPAACFDLKKCPQYVIDSK